MELVDFIEKFAEQFDDVDVEQLKYGKKQGHLFSRKFDIDKYPKMKEIVLEIINLKIEGE